MIHIKTYVNRLQNENEVRNLNQSVYILVPVFVELCRKHKKVEETF